MPLDNSLQEPLELSKTEVTPLNPELIAQIEATNYSERLKNHLKNLPENVVEQLLHPLNQGMLDELERDFNTMPPQCVSEA